MATAAIARLSWFRKSSYIIFPTKHRLYNIFTVSILLRDMETSHGHAERTLNTIYTKPASHFLHIAQDQRERPVHDNSTCWPTRTPNCDRRTMKTGLVWTSNQARLSVISYTPRHAIGRSPSRSSEEKLNGQDEKVGVRPHG
ncbi:hypothetical protein DPMN_055876 [Dreissena polymorpha]|uniref:Uncharacterized protein n=1 Tax=Dreissena polymorpha TaxID=45954 RepID=A0A9D4HUH6_DREPO|nr:hypothetical protein DPMN_055876 [Dreissena polymorpha]